MSDDLKDRASQAYEVLLRVAFPILLGIAGWTATSIFDHESRLTTIEASRYTAQDAAQDSKSVAAGLALVNERLTRIETLLEGRP